MKAMLLEFPAPVLENPLHLVDLPSPLAGPGQVLIRVSHCGICHTDLHTVEGELPLERLPLIPGHQVVGRVMDRGGTLALGGIYMSPIPKLDYDQDLYYEKTMRSVTANTRQDGRELLELAARIPIHPQVQLFPLEEANRALQLLKAGEIDGAGVLTVNP